MIDVAREVETTETKRDPSLVLRTGFHAVPSMDLLHAHIVSQDFVRMLPTAIVSHAIGCLDASSLARACVQPPTHHQAHSNALTHTHTRAHTQDSSWLKTKKHWNSFTSEFFLSADFVLSELETKVRATQEAHAPPALLSSSSTRRSHSPSLFASLLTIVLLQTNFFASSLFISRTCHRN